MSATLLDARRRAHAHRRVPHPARRRSRRARGRGHHAARPQRRRQDHDAAHHHGPVAGLARAASRFDGAAHRRACATPDIAQLGIAYVPESMGIFSDLTVQENLVLAARAARRRLDDARLDWIFGFFPALKKFWLSRAGKLSGGQKQMLAIARAIVEPRELLLIDEPSKGLAPAIIDSLIACLRRSSAAARPSCWSSRTSASRASSATRWR